MRRLGLLLLLTLASATLLDTAFAQPAEPAPAINITAAENADIERRIRRMSEELHSPFCPGKSLMACTSFQAYQLRQEMVVMARAGKDDDQIVADLKVRYGTEVANPPQPWYTALVPFLPYIFGAIVLLIVARRWMIGARDEPESQEVAPDGDEAARLARLRARVAQHDDE
jgi:cytochrome c-type biogenesis protein CcmH/NrfF